MLNPPLETAIEISQFQIGDKILRTPIKSTVPDIQCRVRCWRFGSVQPRPRSTRTRKLLIDNGIQLKALQHSSLSLKDVDAQVQDSMGISIIVSTAKAHSECGREERRIYSTPISDIISSSIRCALRSAFSDCLLFSSASSSL